VVALALVFVGIRVVPGLYQTRAMLVSAYVVLFLPLAVGAIRAALMQVPPSMEEAARTLGHSRLSVLTRVVLPIARRGALAGGALVALTVVKELPATLLLAPTGFDTLATRVWSATNQAFFAQAAVPALTLLVLASMPHGGAGHPRAAALAMEPVEANPTTAPATVTLTRSPAARSRSGPRRARSTVPSASRTWRSWSCPKYETDTTSAAPSACPMQDDSFGAQHRSDHIRIDWLPGLQDAHHGVDAVRPEPSSREQVRLADELGDERCPRLGVQRVGVRQLVQLSGGHHGNLVGEGQRLFLVVGDEHRGGSRRSQNPAHIVSESHPQPGVEVGERLVQQHHRGPGCQRACQCHPLLLPTRQMRRQPVGK
jgi:hypothetical protein